MNFGVHHLIVGCPLAGNVARKRATYSFWRRDYQSREACAAMPETCGTDSPASNLAGEATT
jgi:hypothetical protein